MKECRHRPPCHAHVTAWLCGQRTNLEAAVNRGLISRVDAERLAAKWRLTLTPPSRVFKGQPETKTTQERLL